MRKRDQGAVPFDATHSHEIGGRPGDDDGGERYASLARETPPSGEGSRMAVAGHVGGADVVGHDRPHLPPENHCPAMTISDKW
jgi:hypothetical protein